MTAAPDRYRVRIDGPDIEVDRQVAREVADRVLRAMLGEGAAPTPAEKPSVGVSRGGGVPSLTTGSSEQPPISMREYLNQYEPRRMSEKIVAIGTFLKDKKGLDSFSKDDLISGFESAEESAPKNPHRDISATVRLGWIAEKTGAPDNYYVTATGRTALEGKFSSAPKRKKGGKKKRKKQAAGA